MIDLKVNKNYIWIYFITFFALWCIRELWLVHYLDLMDSVPRALTSAIIKIVIWVIPVIILVKLMEKSVPFSYLRLRHNFRKGLKMDRLGILSLHILFCSFKFHNYR